MEFQREKKKLKSLVGKNNKRKARTRPKGNILLRLFKEVFHRFVSFLNLCFYLQARNRQRV